jgi:hypothetical protein
MDLIEPIASQASDQVFPLIVAGMHRSGTSLTASFFQALGVDVGANLYAADQRNQKGYFEDVDFLEFQRSVLQKCCNPGEAGWADWGWTENEQLHAEKFADYIEPAQKILASRAECGSIWGWKDPRTSLMLDFWQQLLPDARYILVYRFPWDVADSILRLHSPIFSQYPDYAIRIWAFYNRHLLKFYHEHRDRCILVSINGFLTHPDLLIDLLQSKFHLLGQKSDPQNLVASIYDPKLFGALDHQHSTVKLLQQIYPECLSIHAQLDQAADLPSDLTSTYGDSDSREPNFLAIRAALSLHYQLLQAESKSQVIAIAYQSQHSNLISQLQAESQTKQAELEQTINNLTAEIAAMKTSKFWQIRQAWIACKNALGKQFTN